jgi:hypothetical protein
MEIGSLLISIFLFVVFVPGVVVTLPSKGSKGTVLVVHALLFAVVASVVMTIYWGVREGFGNFGHTCPNGYRQTEDGGCVPAGRQTYTPGSLGEKTV